MATNSDHVRGGGSHSTGSGSHSTGSGTHSTGSSSHSSGGHSSKKKTSKQRAARKRLKIVIFAVEILVLVAMAAVLYVVFTKTDEESSPYIASFPTEAESLVIAEEVQEAAETGTMKGYWNIALFGIDGETQTDIIKGGNSDTIIIASINLDTGDVKLVSILRDSYLNINPSGTADYRKANAAYASGGGEQAVQMLNANLDMNITDYIAIGYQGMIDLIDGLGGIYVDVDDEELTHINNYQYSIAKALGDDPNDYTKVTKTGYQKLNGLQATAYCRIRYKTGNDFGRTESQREVLMAIEEQIKAMASTADGLLTLADLATTVMSNVVTSLTMDDVTEYLAQVGNFSIVDEAALPQDGLWGNANMGSKGAIIVYTSLEDNVVWLHKFLFDDEDYTVSSTVKEYSAKIAADTAAYMTD